MLAASLAAAQLGRQECAWKSNSRNKRLFCVEPEDWSDSELKSGSKGSTLGLEAVNLRWDTAPHAKSKTQDRAEKIKLWTVEMHPICAKLVSECSLGITPLIQGVLKSNPWVQCTLDALDTNKRYHLHLPFSQGDLQHKLLLSISSFPPPADNNENRPAPKPKWTPGASKSRSFWSSKVGLYLTPLGCAGFPQGYSPVKTLHSLQRHRSDSVRTPAGARMCSFICLLRASVRKLEVQLEFCRYFLRGSNKSISNTHVHTQIVTQPRW